MVFIIYKVLFAFTIGLQLKMMNLIYVNGNIDHFCKLENHTIELKICKTSPRLTLPVCVGFCSSSTQWNFDLNRFVHRTSACTVTRYRTEQFTCLDSTHTAVEIIIPLACSCTKYYCRNHPSQQTIY
jgi:hypothetical protein